MSEIRLHVLEEQVDALAGRLAVIERLLRQLAQESASDDGARRLRGVDQDEVHADISAREHRLRRDRQVQDFERLNRDEQEAAKRSAALLGLEHRLHDLERSVKALRRA